MLQGSAEPGVLPCSMCEGTYRGSTGEEPGNAPEACVADRGARRAGSPASLGPVLGAKSAGLSLSSLLASDRGSTAPRCVSRHQLR